MYDVHILDLMEKNISALVDAGSVFSIMRKFKAVVFDCDGVMFDSRQANINFYNHILEHFNLPPMEEEEEKYVHMHTANESVRYIFRGTPYTHVAQQYRVENDYSPFIKDMIIEPGLKELLKMLKPKYGLGIATNRSNTIGEVLKSNSLEDFFDIVVSSLDVQQPKPHPESLSKILSFFRIDPEQALYVGDSIVDCEMAKAAGVPFVAYKNCDLDADYHVDHHKEIAHIVGMINCGMKNRNDRTGSYP